MVYLVFPVFFYWFDGYFIIVRVRYIVPYDCFRKNAKNRDNVNNVYYRRTLDKKNKRYYKKMPLDGDFISKLCVFMRWFNV